MDYRGAGLSKYHGSHPWDYFQQVGQPAARPAQDGGLWVVPFRFLRAAAAQLVGRWGA
jgi:hypothetical protein